MLVTSVYDLEREARSGPQEYGNYRNSRRRSQSRDNASGSRFPRESGKRYGSTTRSASRGRSSSRRRSNSAGSAYNNQQWQSPEVALSNFTHKLRGVYNKKVVSNIDSYVEATIKNAVEVNNINFLTRCGSHRMIPEEYWVDATNVRKTREVLRFLEQCASRLMLEDIRMHQKTTEVLARSITKSRNYLKANMSDRDFTRLEKLVDAHFKEMFDLIRKRQRSDFARLQQLDHKKGESRSKKNGSPGKSPGGRQGRRNGRQDSERSRSASDGSSAQASD